MSRTQRISRAQVYADAQATCGLKEGDRVKVLRKAESYEAGWSYAWLRDMDHLVGKTGRVTEVYLGCIGVRFPDGDTWNFPYFILEKMAAPASEFLPFDKVLVRNADNEPWEPDMYMKYSPDEICPHNTFKGRFRQCIPYEDNEYLLGRTDRPDGK